MNHLRKQVLLLLSIVFLGLFTLVLAAAPMRAWVLSYGRRGFLAVVLGLSGVMAFLGWGPVGAVIALQAIMVAAYDVFEKQGLPLQRSVIYSLLVTLAVGIAGTYSWTQFSGQPLSVLYEKPVADFVTQIQQVNPKVEIVAETVVAQLPSGVVICFLLSLVLALALAPRIQNMLGVDIQNFMAVKFRSFRLPDMMIWVAFLVLIGAFIDKIGIPPSMQTASINVMNVLVLLYFFQGLAIITCYLDSYKVGPFWRVIWMVFFTLQLFLFVSCLGLIDYWLDFRTRLYKKKAVKKPPTKPTKKTEDELK